MSRARGAQVQVQGINDGFGALVTGIGVLDMTAAQLQELLVKYRVVRFEASDLTDEEQEAVLDRLGDPYIHPLALLSGITEARCSRIVDDAEHPPYQDQWHTDVTWDPEPPRIGSLRVVEMPETGGNTLWADMYAAADALSDELRQEIGELRALHDMGNGRSFISKAGGEVVERARSEYPGVERPIIGTHRITGREYLNVNAGFTNHVVGVEAERSHALLETLFAHVENEAPKVECEWQVGEFVVWDEECTQHFAAADHFPARREMARYVVK